jgi:hypothetical protein
MRNYFGRFAAIIIDLASENMTTIFYNHSLKSDNYTLLQILQCKFYIVKLNSIKATYVLKGSYDVNPFLKQLQLQLLSFDRLDQPQLRRCLLHPGQFCPFPQRSDADEFCQSRGLLVLDK